MSELRTRLNELTVRALSPDGRVRALLKGRRQPVISFADRDDYGKYRDAAALAGEVSGALERAFKGRDDGRKMIVDKYSRLERDESEHWNATVRRMYTELHSTTVTGHSSGDTIRVDTKGMRSFRVRIKPGTLDAMTPEQFCAEVNIAVRDAYSRYIGTMRRMKTDVLGGATRSRLRDTFH